MTIELTFNALNFDDLLSQIRAFGKGTPERVELEGPVREAKPEKRAPKAPVAETKPIEEIFEEAEVDAAAQAMDAEMEGALTPKGLLELKSRMLTTLQAAIAEGKIDQLRALLAAEGGGAKSFPEVGVEYFPAIEKAVQNGALK